MNAKKATTGKRNGKNSQVSTHYKVTENKDTFEDMLDTINKLFELVDKCRAYTKEEMLELIKDLRKQRVKLKSHVLIDEIKVNDPIEFISRIRQMKEDGIIDFEPMGMARTLILSCVFVRTITVNRDQISKDLK